MAPQHPDSPPSPNDPSAPTAIGVDPNATHHADASTDAPILAIGGLLLLEPASNRFEEISAVLLDSVDPNDPQERLLAEMVLMAADRLRRAALSEPKDAIPDLAWCRFQALAERNFRAASKELRQHRASKAKTAAAAPTKKASKPRAGAAAEAPEPALAPPPAPESTPEEIAEAAANWRKHIALIPSMSDEWPIILRLGREVEDVTAWLDAGKSEDELMSWYPGLTRADIAACRACDLEGLCGPFDTADGPYPPGLPVLDRLPDPETGP